MCVLFKRCSLSEFSVLLSLVLKSLDFEHISSQIAPQRECVLRCMRNIDAEDK